MPRRSAPVAPAAPTTGFQRIEERFPWPWQGVSFSPTYILFLGYVFVISAQVLNLGQVAMGLALLTLTMGAKDRWKFPAPFVFMVAFFLVIAVTFQSTEYRSFVYRPLTDMLKVFLITAVAVSVLDSRPRIRFFMFFYLAVFALFPVRGGLFNWFIYNSATQGRVAWNLTFENPNDYAAYMIFPLGLCLAVFLAEKSKLLKQASFLGLVAIPLLIFMTQSRGAILALGAGVMTFILTQGKGRAKTLLAVGAIAAVVVVFAPSGVWSRLNSLKSATESGNLTQANDSRSAEQRFEIWRVALKVHQAFPITGVGWGAYPNAHSEYSRRSGIAVIAGGARDAHNTYLTVLCESGWVGFLLWMGMIMSIVVTSIRAMRRVRPYINEYALQIRMLLLALLSYGAAGVFGSFAHVTFSYLHLAALLSLSMIALREAQAFETGGARRVRGVSARAS